jgi:hypothetical protein
VPASERILPTGPVNASLDGRIPRGWKAVGIAGSWRAPQRAVQVPLRLVPAAKPVVHLGFVRPKGRRAAFQSAPVQGGLGVEARLRPPFVRGGRTGFQGRPRHVRAGASAWLRGHGYLDERPIEERSNEPEAQTALDACADIAMARGQVATLPRPGVADAADEDHERSPDRTTVAVDHQGFNLHAGVRIHAGDDLGRERLADTRFARPSLWNACAGCPAGASPIA